jgi:transposase
VEQIDQRALLARLGPVTRASLAGVRQLTIEEFAMQKGQRYATVVVDVERKRVLWVARGSGRAALQPFFDLLGPEGCAAIQAVVMDMSGAFAEEVRARCPQAAIVYDLFHVAAKFGRDVVDRVRVDETSRIAKTGGARISERGPRAA